MMGLVSFAILCKLAVLILYGAIFIVSMIFTFSLDMYNVLDAILGFEFFSKQRTAPLEKKNFYFIDDWLFRYNKIIGPIIGMVALLDIIVLFKIINLF